MVKRVYQVSALIKAHDILEFISARGKTTFTEIYSELGLPKSTTYKTISTLESLGYIRAIGGEARYCLGLKLLDFGSRASTQIDLFTEARPLVKRLSMDTQRTCQIGVLDGLDVVYVVKENTHCLIRLDTWVGKRIPLYSSSMGKVLLAWQKEREVNNLLDQITFRKIAPNTITDKVDLLAELPEIKSKGWARDDEESAQMVRCISAPIINQAGHVCAALGVSTLTELDGEQEMLEMTAKVVDCAQELSQRMGAEHQHLQESVS